MKNFFFVVCLLVAVSPVYSQWTLLTDDYDPAVSIISYDSNIITGVGYWAPYNLGISHDHGMTWEGSYPFPESYAVNHLLLSGEYIYASLSDGIQRSPKEVLSWSSYNEGLPTQSYFKTCQWDSLMVAISNCSVYWREEGSGSWNLMCENSPAVTNYDMDFRDGLIVLAGSNGIWESQDTGATWINWQNVEFLMNAVIISGDTIIGASPGGIYRKLRSSGNIAKVSDGLMTVWNPYGYEYYGEFTSFYATRNTIFVTGETGIYQLQQGIWHWNKLDGPGSWVYNLADDGESMFAVSGYNSTWASPLSQLIVGTPDQKPETVKINIFPNPASDLLTIDFKGFDSETSVLYIYNQYGAVMDSQVVAIIHDRVRINVEKLSPGLYFGKLQSENGQNIIFKFLVGY